MSVAIHKLILDLMPCHDVYRWFRRVLAFRLLLGRKYFLIAAFKNRRQNQSRRKAA